MDETPEAHGRITSETLLKYLLHGWSTWKALGTWVEYLRNMGGEPEEHGFSIRGTWLEYLRNMG